MYHVGYYLQRWGSIEKFANYAIEGMVAVNKRHLQQATSQFGGHRSSHASLATQLLQLAFRRDWRISRELLSTLVVHKQAERAPTWAEKQLLLCSKYEQRFCMAKEGTKAHTDEILDAGGQLSQAHAAAFGEELSPELLLLLQRRNEKGKEKETDKEKEKEKNINESEMENDQEMRTAADAIEEEYVGPTEGWRCYTRTTKRQAQQMSPQFCIMEDDFNIESSW